MSRRDVKKNMIAWLCVWVFLISLTGCGKQDTKADHMLRVGVVTYTPDDPFINAMTDIIKSNLKAKESNTMKVIVSVRSGDNDQQEQDEIVEEMIDAGCDVLCVNLVDGQHRRISSVWRGRMIFRLFSLTGNRCRRIFFSGISFSMLAVMQHSPVRCRARSQRNIIKNHPEVDKNGDGEDPNMCF